MLKSRDGIELPEAFGQYQDRLNRCQAGQLETHKKVADLCEANNLRYYLIAGSALGAAHIQPLLEYYESTDVPSLTRKISSIPAFKGIGSPITADGTIDYQSRYIQADIRIALAYIVELVRKIGISLGVTNTVLGEVGKRGQQ